MIAHLFREGRLHILSSYGTKVNHGEHLELWLALGAVTGFFLASFFSCWSFSPLIYFAAKTYVDASGHDPVGLAFGRRRFAWGRSGSKSKLFRSQRHSPCRAQSEYCACNADRNAIRARCGLGLFNCFGPHKQTQLKSSRLIIWRSSGAIVKAKMIADEHFRVRSYCRGQRCSSGRSIW